jgi:hypothetical protein
LAFYLLYPVFLTSTGRTGSSTPIFIIFKFNYFNKENLISQQKFAFVISTISVADPDPGSGALNPLDPGWVKKPGSGSGINTPDHITETMETLFGLKYLKFL